MLNSELHGKLSYDTVSAFGYSALNYGRGGYFVELPNNPAKAKAIIDQLKEDRWIDQGTRAVGITFNVYNTNSRGLTTVRVGMSTC